MNETGEQSIIQDYTPGKASVPVEASKALADPLSLLGDVGVKLQFHLGSAAISIQRLSQLKTGETVTLDQGSVAEIDISLNGHIIGSGALVLIDGALGVQIKELLR